MASQAIVRGDGCRLVLRVTAYERPDEGGFDDANWLVGEVELESGTTGTFRASHPVALRTDDLSEFRDELAPLVDSLNGTARLRHLEEQLGCTIEIENGKGNLTAFVAEHVGSELRVGTCQTDQSYLTRTLAELNARLDEFPVRGRR